MDQIDLGFVKKCDSWMLESRFFPSKIGGKPAWLDLKNLPGVEDVECKNCKNPCIFLCQVYAPYEDYAHAFHRTIFIFICQNDKCCKPNDNGNLYIFRSQLPRKNEFYPFEPPEEKEDWRTDINVEKFSKICRVCCLNAPSHCAKCKRVNYCCRQHQRLDWKAGHKAICDTDSKDQTNPMNTPLENILFPEYELMIENLISDTKDNIPDSEKEQEEIEKYKNLVESGNAGTLQDCEDADQDLTRMASCDEDKVFAKFQKTIRDDPDQVLRYNRGGTPLLISTQSLPSDIPKCENCNGDRQFEFQIMPQLLNLFKSTEKIENLDWGVLLIFTCKNSCDVKSGYIPEFIWKQDIV